MQLCGRMWEGVWPDVRAAIDAACLQLNGELPHAGTGAKATGRAGKAKTRSRGRGNKGTVQVWRVHAVPARGGGCTRSDGGADAGAACGTEARCV